MNPESTGGPELPPEVVAEVNRELGVLRNPNTSGDERKKATAVIARFLQGHLFGLARWRAAGVAGLSASDLFQDAFVGLLRLLGLPEEAARPADEARHTIEDAERLRIVFCHLLSCRYFDELRQRLRHPGDRGAGQGGAPLADQAAPQHEADRRLRVARRLMALHEALVWLDDRHPRLGAAFKARLLNNHNVRFSQAGRSFSRVVREEVRDEERTYREMGELLGCSLAQARERYQQAEAVLRERFPDLLDANTGVR